jgi:nucleoside-diphosphate-sugar epimerase
VDTQGLRNVLGLAVEKGISKVFWPSSVTVFGGDEGRTRRRQTDAVKPATNYGVSAAAREFWSQYFWSNHAVDVRSLRLPGVISYKPLPDGEEIFDFVGAMFRAALQRQPYTCYLQEGTVMPMIYLPDAVRATLELMEAPASALSVRNGYNINAMSFSPGELARAIGRYVPGFSVDYQPDHREGLAQKLPASVDDAVAAKDWDWEFAFSLPETVKHMLGQLSSSLDLKPEHLRQMQLPVFF